MSNLRERQRKDFMKMVDSETARLLRVCSVDEIVGKVEQLVKDSAIRPPFAGACLEMTGRHREGKWLSDAQKKYLARSAAFATAAARPHVT